MLLQPRPAVKDRQLHVWFAATLTPDALRATISLKLIGLALGGLVMMMCRVRQPNGVSVGVALRVRVAETDGEREGDGSTDGDSDTEPPYVWLRDDVGDTLAVTDALRARDAVRLADTDGEPGCDADRDALTDALDRENEALAERLPLPATLLERLDDLDGDAVRVCVAAAALAAILELPFRDAERLRENEVKADTDRDTETDTVFEREADTELDREAVTDAVCAAACDRDDVTDGDAREPVTDADADRDAPKDSDGDREGDLEPV